MSQYDKLDSLIVDSIKGGCHSFSAIFKSRGVFDEAMRLSHAVGRDTNRIVDGRLQALRRRGLIVYVTEALRRRGLIVYVTNWGWRVKEAA